MLKTFAIRLKDHVEFRAAITRPKAIVSKLIRPVKDSGTYEYFPGPPYYLPKPGKLILKQTYYVGGRVVGFGKYNKFRANTGITLKDDGIIEIPSDKKAAALRAKL